MPRGAVQTPADSSLVFGLKSLKGLGFGSFGLGFRVLGLGFRVWELRVGVWGLGFRV